MLLISIGIFLIFLFAIGLWSQTKVNSEADFIVAGRRFNLWLSIFSLFATWFGAGTLITATDEIRMAGLQAIALEPLGAGLCLVIAGLFFAGPLWRMNIYTVSDFYRIKFGKKAEYISVFANIPVYTGWIAVQLMALSQLLNSFFGWEVFTIVLIIAFLSMFLTMIGGLWSVTITDSVQLLIIIIGLLLLAFNVFDFYGEGSLLGGFYKLWENTEQSLQVVVPHDNFNQVAVWTSVLMVSSLGNLSGQDLVQRIFAAKSEKVARNACVISGVSYIFFGAIPALLGVFSYQIFQGEFSGSVVSHYAKFFLSPAVRTIFILCIFATVFSTITSAILSPASIIAHNYLKDKFPRVSTLKLCRVSVVIITFLSVLVAFMGENIYAILENSYALGLVCFFTPLYFGIFTNMLDERACLVSMVVGTLSWLVEFIFPFDFPYALVATGLSFLSYLISYRILYKANLSCEESHL